MVFAPPPRQFYHDGTIPAHLSGLSHLDNFIMTRKLSSISRDFAKTHANPDTDGNFPYHRAVIKNANEKLSHSASRTANYKTYHDKRTLQRLPVYTATRN
jgi:hypothetical protein